MLAINGWGRETAARSRPRSSDRGATAAEDLVAGDFNPDHDLIRWIGACLKTAGSTRASTTTHLSSSRECTTVAATASPHDQRVRRTGATSLYTVLPSTARTSTNATIVLATTLFLYDF